MKLKNVVIQFQKRSYSFPKALTSLNSFFGIAIFFFLFSLILRYSPQCVWVDVSQYKWIDF